jgi:hypothetical protein
MVIAIIDIPGWGGGMLLVHWRAASCMQAKAPAARGSGELRSIVAKQHQESGGVVGGRKGRACSRRALANGTQEYGFV